MQREVLNSLNN